MTGTIKLWNPARGFGFVQPDEGGDDHFVHISACLGDARRTGFAPGDRVAFTSERGERGLKAVNVKALD